MELACFDFDGTMIRGDSIAAYLKGALQKKLISPAEYAAVGWHTARYFLGLESGNRVKTRALQFTRKLTEAQRRELDRDFALNTLLPRLYPGARARWEQHRREGKKLLLVSASTENYMRFVADALQADALLCTRMLPDGTVTDNCKGEEKVRRIREWLGAQDIRADFAASFAYGDSASDLPMLRLTGHPVQVNPRKKLRKAAPDMEAVHWENP